MAGVLALLCLFIALLGCAYLAFAVAVTGNFATDTAAKPADLPPVTILKPLKGDEPRLFANLASFCDQDYPAPIQLIFGVPGADDAAIPVVQRLMKALPRHQTDLVIDPTTFGANPKISNLNNMMRKARYPVIALADSDIAVPRDYLLRLVAALERPGVGGVTCLYHGVSIGGFWSKLSALGVDGHFVPNVLIGLRTTLATPCFGSTIALRRSDLDAIGGFAAFTDCLADDYAIGAALRKKDLKVVVAPFLIGHSCVEASLAQLWAHELRWARTIRSVDPTGYGGSFVTHPLAFALLACLFGAIAPGAAIALFAILSRIVLLHVVTSRNGLAPHPYWLLPIRDLLSFTIFVWSFFGRDLMWRGHEYHVRADGTLIPG
jgi:ceramide glucosyltransferase